MKRLLTSTALALAILAFSHQTASAWPCCGSGYFSVGLGCDVCLRGFWNCGCCPPPCGPSCSAYPQVFDSLHAGGYDGYAPAPAFGGLDGAAQAVPAVGTTGYYAPAAYGLQGPSYWYGH